MNKMKFGGRKKTASNKKQQEGSPDENQNLLSPADDNDDVSVLGSIIHSIGELKKREELYHHEEKEEFDAKVSPIELFSDLVMVVAIHAISDMLLEGEEEDESSALDEAHHSNSGEEESAEDSKYYKYFLRVFLLWYLWHHCMLVTNAGNLFYKNHMGLKLHLFIFAIMFIILGIAKACEAQNDSAAVILYLLGRYTEVRAFTLLSQREKPPQINDKQYMNIQNLAKILPFSFFLMETVPFLLAVFCADNINGGIFGQISMVFSFIAIIAVIVTRFVGGLIYELKNEDAAQNSFGLEHLQERYELITLIFMGELCFAAASKPGYPFASFCCFLTAIGCYGLCFAIKDHSRIEGFGRPGLSYHAQHLHFGKFCSIPVIGVGFVKAIEYFSEVKATGSHNSATDEVVEHENLNEIAESVVMTICYSIAVFMACSSLVSFASKENPSKKTKVPSWIRYGSQLIVGGLIALFPSIANGNVSFTILCVPFLMFLVGAFQLWGIQSEASTPSDESEKYHNTA